MPLTSRESNAASTPAGRGRGHCGQCKLPAVATSAWGRGAVPGMLALGKWSMGWTDEGGKSAFLLGTPFQTSASILEAPAAALAAPARPSAQ